MSGFDAAKFATRQIGHVTIVDASGRIMAGQATGSLRELIKELTQAGHKNVLLNLTDTSYIDSAGIGELVGACTSLRTMGGDLRLYNPQPRVSRLLDVTKVNGLFAIFADENAAVASFPAASAGL